MIPFQNVAEEDLRVLCEVLYETSPMIDLESLDRNQRQRLGKFASDQTEAASQLLGETFGTNVAKLATAGFKRAWACASREPLSAELIYNSCEEVNLQAHKFKVARIREDELRAVKAVLMMEVLPSIYVELHGDPRRPNFARSNSGINDSKHPKSTPVTNHLRYVI